MMNNWESVSLFHIADNSPKSFVDGDWIESPYITDEGIRLIQTGNIGIGVFKNKNKKYISENSFKLLKCTEVFPGDVLICRLAEPIGRACIVPENNERYITSVDVSILRVSDKYSKELIHLYLNTEEFLKKAELLSGGSTRQRISRTNLGNIKFDLPPLPQQQKIAKILTTCDEVIEKTEAAIAKYQAMKQGMMHDLFTRGIDVTTGKLRPKQSEVPELYKESELGWIPKEWEVKRLEEITNYVDYRGKTPPKTDKGIFLITAKNIKQGYIDYENSKEYIPEFAYKSAMSRGIPEIGDVLITTEAPMGNVAQINFEGLALAQRVIKYRCIPIEMYNDFLKHSMMSEYFQRELEAESTGSTVKGIKGSRLHQLNVFKPKLKEQEKIIQSITPLEIKLQIEQSALSKYQQIKAGLMQDLLSGKVEVEV